MHIHCLSSRGGSLSVVKGMTLRGWVTHRGFTHWDMYLSVGVFVGRCTQEGLTPVCDWIENSDRTGPDWNHFCRNRNWITSLKNKPDWPVAHSLTLWNEYLTVGFLVGILKCIISLYKK